MTANDRREPILEKAELPNEENPFLLTELLREGLPRPLWRRPKGEESTASQEPLQNHVSDRSEPQFVPAPIAPLNQRAEPHITEESGWEEQPAVSVPHSPAESIEATELTLALQRIRGLSTASADTNQAISAPEDLAETAVAKIELAETTAETTVDSASTVDPEEIPTEEATTVETTPAFSPDTAVESQAEWRTPEASSTSSADLPLLTPSHQRELALLLHAEVERRVVAEMEERITQYLQQVWKEQVSLTLMRGVALEGIRLREGMAELVHSALPEVLQRVVSEELQNARLSTDTNDGSS